MTFSGVDAFRFVRHHILSVNRVDMSDNAYIKRINIILYNVYLYVPSQHVNAIIMKW